MVPSRCPAPCKRRLTRRPPSSPGLWRSHWPRQEYAGSEWRLPPRARVLLRGHLAAPELGDGHPLGPDPDCFRAHTLSPAPAQALCGPRQGCGAGCPFPPTATSTDALSCFPPLLSVWLLGQVLGHPESGLRPRPLATAPPKQVTYLHTRGGQPPREPWV